MKRKWRPTKPAKPGQLGTPMRAVAEGVCDTPATMFPVKP